MDMPNGQLGEIIEKGQQATTNTIKSVVSDTASSVSDQLGIKNESNNQAAQAQTQATQVQQQPQAQPSGEAGAQPQLDNNTNEFTREMVEDFYAPSVSAQQQSLAEAEEAQTQAKIAQVRQQIFQERHNEAYFNAVLNADAPKPQEERPAEKAERQKMEDLQLDQQNKPDEIPIAKLRGMTRVETAPGTVG